VSVVQRRVSKLQLMRWWCQLCTWTNTCTALYLDQHVYRFVSWPPRVVEFYSTSSLKQQSTGRHVDPLGHTTCIMIPIQPDVALTP